MSTITELELSWLAFSQLRSWRNNFLSKRYQLAVFHHMEVDTLRPKQNDLHFADLIFKLIFLEMKIVVFWFKFHWNVVSFSNSCFLNESCVLIQISLKCVPKGPIIWQNKSILQLLMAWFLELPGHQQLWYYIRQIGCCRSQLLVNH